MKLSDRDRKLLSRSFNVVDPESLENMSLTMPADYEQAVVEFEFDVNPGKGGTRDKVWCAHDQRPTHWKGYVMSANGIRFTIGHNCGAKIYGLEFKATAREFGHLKERKNHLVRLQRVFEKLPPLIESLDRLLSARALVQMRILQNKLQNDFIQITQSLRVIAHSPNHMVSKTVRVRDTDREAARADQNAQIDDEISSMTTSEMKWQRKHGSLPTKESEAKPIFKLVEEDAFILRGKSLLLHDSEQIRKHLETENARLRAIYKELKDVDTDKLERTAILRIFKKLDASKDHLGEMEEYLKAPVQFLRFDHLESIADWATNNLDIEDNYTLKDGVFTRFVRNSVENDKALNVSIAYDQPDLRFLLDFFGNPKSSALRNAA